MKSIKRTICVFLVALLCMSSLSACSDKNTDLVWSEISSQYEGYVYELYYFEVPTVTDPEGKPLKVKVSVKDKDGKDVDTTGGFFAIRGTDAYTLTYSVEYGGKTYSKTTTVKGIPKTEYGLNTIPLYGLNEEIDLKSHVTSTEAGEMSFGVSKEGKSISVKDGKIKVTETGTYDVVVSIPKQPDYTYSVTVVDKSLYPNPNGMITDDAGAESISAAAEIDYVKVTASGAKSEWVGNAEVPYTEAEQAAAQAAAEAKLKELTLAQSASLSVSFDETAKFDASSNGSTKISVDYPEGCQPFDLPITIKPQFNKKYYESLANSGYEYVAVRMKLEDGEDVLENYGLLYFGGNNGTSVAFRTVSQEGEVSEAVTASALWSGTGYQKSGLGWFELLLPIRTFIGSYAEQMQLFKLRTFASVTGYKDGSTKLNGNNGGLDIYIDNIYAAKEMDGVDVSRKALTGDSFAISELQIKDTIDVDGLKVAYDIDGERAAFGGDKVTFASEGVHGVEVRARNRYGVRKAEITVGGNYQLPAASGIVKEFSSADDVIVSEISAVNTASGGTKATVTYKTDVKYDDQNSAGSVCVSGIAGNTWADISVKPMASKAYYAFLKDNGYRYITVRLGFVGVKNTNECAYLHAGGTDTLHQNNATSTVVGTKDGKGTFSTWFTEDGEYWTEVSVSIDEFLASYDKQGTPILRVFGAYSNSSIYLDGVYVTKDGTITK